jgi:ornithine cyclodeaminase/alanine dehydrogenase-like protein (mu-crystallin family)
MGQHQIPLKYLSQEDLLKAGCFDIRMAMHAAEQAMIKFKQGQVLFPDKIVQIFNEESQERINCLPATFLQEKICGVKWVSVFPPNPIKYGTQNLSAIIILSEITKGYPIAVMDGTLCSNIRVAAIGAIAAKHLARQDSEIIGFIGSGEQARMHLIGMKTVMPSIRECRIAAKTEDEELQFIREMEEIFSDIRFLQCKTNGETAMAGADVLVTATSAQAPLLKANWMKPGAFYSHIGGWEDEYAVALQCDKIVCDDWSVVKHRAQTLSRMYKDGLLKDENIHADLVDLVAGEKPGRQNNKERIYFNAVGLSYVDVAIAMAMYEKAQNTSVGNELDLQETMIFKHENLKQFIHL